MKILVVADHEQREIWDFWDTNGAKRLEGVELILSAGDIKASYLEFLVTMLGVPCLYVRGNHDSAYETDPPEGCICIDGRIAEICKDEKTGWLQVDLVDGQRAGLKRTAGKIISQVSSALKSLAAGSARSRYEKGVAAANTSGQNTSGPMVRVVGLGGSMRYRKGSDMYTERVMARRVRRMMLYGGRMNRKGFDRLPGDADHTDRRCVNIFLTHAPCKGHGDLEDLAHTGFACFNDYLMKVRPDYHCYGHVHMEYGRIKRETVHPSGTRLINVSGRYILDI